MGIDVCEVVYVMLYMVWDIQWDMMGAVYVCIAVIYYNISNYVNIHTTRRMFV